MKNVVIGSVVLASGMPKIGVTLTGSNRQALLGQAAQVLTSVAQIVEWRLDTYQELDNRAELINTAVQLQQLLGTIPVIATIRGSLLAPTTYYQIYQTLVNNRAVAAIDVESRYLKAPQFGPLVTQMRTHQIRLILSQSITGTLPSPAELVTSYQTMAVAGADVIRMSVQPTQALDVVTLMAATTQAHQVLDVPLIATASGSLGRYSGVCGQLMGSAITFGRVGHVGEHGQLSVSQLKQTLQTLATV
ncbi:type I 3-dehydroquinate dehydratase [Lactobacillus sp. CBA3605]|uniref:type I 3-dehydroquinate dehydratase n=1 Tax=Lactobacillus sp. CBA3605 TaxID=2099788 RepID=UPI000CFD5F10|nr:type I 3-dehydroquinate dehydratase [Lactobacillus sp. CBA3605]AVK61041.1 type I 3-dehydroquinate dehydratase [Lactobacillus sp. CBA3605]